MTPYEPAPDSIGYVRFHGGDSIAELLDSDSWKATEGGRDAPSLASYLETVYQGKFRGPQHGPTGLMLLRQVASDLGGIAVYLLPIEDPDPNVVY